MRARPLHEVSLKELRALLEEEKEYWSGELLWDYSEVSSAVASGVERRALTGRVMHDGPRAVAYCYYMLDSGRAIVGSLFAAEASAGQGLEEELLDAVLARGPGPARATTGSSARRCSRPRPGANGRFARAGFESRRRHYLVRDLRQPLGPAPAHGLPAPHRAPRRPARGGRDHLPQPSRQPRRGPQPHLRDSGPLPRLRGHAGAARGLRPLRRRGLLPGRGTARARRRAPGEPPLAHERPRLPGLGRARGAGPGPRHGPDDRRRSRPFAARASPRRASP